MQRPFRHGFSRPVFKHVRLYRVFGPFFNGVRPLKNGGFARQVRWFPLCIDELRRTAIHVLNLSGRWKTAIHCSKTQTAENRDTFVNIESISMNAPQGTNRASLTENANVSRKCRHCGKNAIHCAMPDDGAGILQNVSRFSNNHPSLTRVSHKLETLARAVRNHRFNVCETLISRARVDCFGSHARHLQYIHRFRASSPDTAEKQHQKRDTFARGRSNSVKYNGKQHLHHEQVLRMARCRSNSMHRSRKTRV